MPELHRAHVTSHAVAVWCSDTDIQETMYGILCRDLPEYLGILGVSFRFDPITIPGGPASAHVQELIADIQMLARKHEINDVALIMHEDCAGQPDPERREMMTAVLGYVLASYGLNVHVFNLRLARLEPVTWEFVPLRLQDIGTPPAE